MISRFTPTTPPVVRFRAFALALISGLISVATPTLSFAQPLGATQLIDLSGGAFNGSSYTGIQRAQGRPNDIFVARQDGVISRVNLSTNAQSTFFTVPAADIATGQYWGLLGFTFAPDFATSGKLYAHVADDLGAADIRNTTWGTTNTNGARHRIYIREYSLNNPLSSTPTLASSKNIIRWDNPLSDHSGGWLGFQPDNPNILWILGGDGGNNDGNPNPIEGSTFGSGGARIRSAQDKSDLLGSLLRVDVSGDSYPGDSNYNYKIPLDNPNYNPAGPDPDPNFAADGFNDAVWTYGNRSPWGASFDRQTGDFIWGEVGQVTREEINFHRKDEITGYSALGGRNYGWRVLEGNLCANRAEYTGNECTSSGSPPVSEFTAPVYDYVHSGGYGTAGAAAFGGRAVTGGYVYRGPVTELQGKYIFGDWSSHQIWAMEINRNANGGLGGLVPGSLTNLSSTFGMTTTNGSSELLGVTAFGEDQAGNLYFVLLGGRLYKVVGVPEPTSAGLLILAMSAFGFIRRRRGC